MGIGCFRGGKAVIGVALTTIPQLHADIKERILSLWAFMASSEVKFMAL
jgi:hypothetical protein